MQAISTCDNSLKDRYLDKTNFPKISGNENMDVAPVELSLFELMSIPRPVDQ